MNRDFYRVYDYMNKDMSVKEWGSHIGEKILCVCDVTGEKSIGVLTGIMINRDETTSLWVDYEFELEKHQCSLIKAD